MRMLQLYAGAAILILVPGSTVAMLVLFPAALPSIPLWFWTLWLVFSACLALDAPAWVERLIPRGRLPRSPRYRRRAVEGRCVVIGEAGLTAILPEPIPAGSVVTVQLPVPTHPTVLESSAVVRNQLGLRHGFEVVSLTDAKQMSISQFCKGLAVQWDVEHQKS